MSTDDKKDNPGNPGHITAELCEAYRETVTAQMGKLEERIDGVKNTIVLGLSITTTIISLIILLAKYSA